jgi:periplasmic protein TonB
MRLQPIGLLVLAALAGCGGDTSSQPQTPIVAPTEVAAVQTPPPDYPMELACANIGGTATLSVTVGVEGKPTEVGLVSSSGNEKLDQLAQERVREWQFKAATRGGQPVPQNIQVPVKFTPPAVRPEQCFALDSQYRGG